MFRTALLVVALVGCKPTTADDTQSTDDTAGTDATTTTDTGTGTEGTEGTGGTEDVASLAGTLTWTLTFDAAAKADGYTDCTYTRTYANGVEQRQNPWLCPQCEVILTNDVTMTDGKDTCFSQISSTDPSPVEFLGWDGTTFYRASSENYLLTEQGAITPDGSDLNIVNHVDGFTFTDSSGVDQTATLDVAGTLTVGTTSADPVGGMTPPSSYACGWPKANPPAYTGDETLAIGAPLPDGVFIDQCGEPMRLDDFRGKWIVLDVSATDCGYCQIMAKDSVQFETDMAAKGYDVVAMTLMEPSLSDTLGVTTVDVLNAWQDKFGTDGPILADRAYGVWVLIAGADALLSYDGSGYPTWVVVDPDGNLVDAHIGYSSWDDAAASIEGH